MKQFEEKKIRRAQPKKIDSLPVEEKKKLKELALNCILEDGRSFDDLRKSGIMKLFNGLMEGMFRLYGWRKHATRIVSRFQTTTSKYGESKSETIENKTPETIVRSIETLPIHWH